MLFQRTNRKPFSLFIVYFVQGTNGTRHSQKKQQMKNKQNDTHSIEKANETVKTWEVIYIWEGSDNNKLNEQKHDKKKMSNKKKEEKALINAKQCVYFWNWTHTLYSNYMYLWHSLYLFSNERNQISCIR